MIKKQRRGTAIVETDKGILVAAGRNKVFLLPGGQAKRFETRRRTAVRELREETGLKAQSIHYLFRHLGRIHKGHKGTHFQDHHKVFLVTTIGIPRPKQEIRYLAWYKQGSRVRISGVTREIIEKYYAIKK